MKTLTKMKKTGNYDEAFLLRLVTRNGFSVAYWEEVRHRTQAGEKFTNREIFELLNDLREQRFGEPAFPSYASFHMWLKRRS